MAKKHKKQLRFSTQRFIVVVIIIFLTTGVLAFICRGPIRNHLFPTLTSVLHKGQMDKAKKEALAQTSEASEPLGLKMDDHTPTHCSLDGAYGISTSVYCINSAWAPAQKINNLPSLNDPVLLQVKANLRSHGWKQDGLEDSTGRILNYSKIFGGIPCYFEVVSVKATQQLIANLLCTKGYRYFGSPY